MAFRVLDEQRFYRLLDVTPTPVFAFVSSPACGACRALRRALAQLPAELGSLTIIELDAERCGGLIEDLEVFHLPAMFLFIDGEYHCEIHSTARPQALAKAIEEAIQQPPQPLP